jgi:hypothetical protein
LKGHLTCGKGLGGHLKATASLLRQAAHAIDSAEPVTQVSWLREWLDETAAERRFTSS